MRIAVLGMGTVGSGVVKVIEENQAEIINFVGEEVEVAYIFSKNINNLHNANLTNITMTTNIHDILNGGVDLVVETLGGIEFAYEIHQQFLTAGIHVVSANKDMLAIYINDLAEIGNKHQAQLGYEASCVGGVPIINALHYGLQANKISRIMGIMNGTTNYILDKMTNLAWGFQEALEQAQLSGFAEADPTNDIGGFDTRRKIALLSRIAYKRNINVDQVAVQGIDEVESLDLRLAQEGGYILKLLGSSQVSQRQITISVEPTFLPVSHPLAAVKNAMNAVYVNGNAVGETMFYGPGAGSLETASAIVSDIMNILKFGFVGNLYLTEQAQIADHAMQQDYYLRFTSEATNWQDVLEQLACDYEVISREAGAIICRDLTDTHLANLTKALGHYVKYPIIKD